MLPHLRPPADPTLQPLPALLCSPSLGGWHIASNTSERCSAAVVTHTAVHGMVAVPATPDSSAAELAELLAAMGIDDDAVATKAAQVVSSGWSSPVGSPPQASDGWQWGSSCDSSDEGGANSAGYMSGASAQRSTQRASRVEREAREAARQASNNAFVHSRQVIAGLKEEAAKAFQSAIDARVRGLFRGPSFGGGWLAVKRGQLRKLGWIWLLGWILLPCGRHPTSPTRVPHLPAPRCPLTLLAAPGPPG